LFLPRRCEKVRVLRNHNVQYDLVFQACDGGGAVPPEINAHGSKVGMLNEELSQLIELEIPRLRRYAMFLARDPEKADDLVQECLVRAIDNIDKFQPGTNIRSWLMTILHNIFVNETKKRRPLLTQDGVIERATPIEGGQEARHQMRDVQRAFEALSWQHRQIIWFICVEQMDYNEVARQLDVPVGTVRSRLCRAREHLKQLMELEGGNEKGSESADAEPGSEVKPRSRGGRQTGDSLRRTGTRG
jgi:RNA polymerase sigma-70 factor (ECF subfamily)